MPGNKVLVLFGPTASGKTAVIEELFIKSKEFSVEIISADSMQVYRGMDIGTAKPSSKERERLPHHLIDIRNPNEQFNAGEFVRLAREAAEAAGSRGAIPVVSGGAGFYLKNLIQGLSSAPPSDLRVRAALKDELAEKGARALMEELASCDSVSALRIHPNDEYRLLRALEVFRLTGRPLSSYAQNDSGGSGTNFDFLLLGLRRGRENLYRRINERCASMFRAGLPGEVSRLFEAGFTPSDPGLRAIGYREFFVEEEGGAQKGPAKYRLSEDLEGVRALVAQNSRRYAKRQNTFFASIPAVNWIDMENEEKALAEIRRKLFSWQSRQL
ncbi:MAG: tRNA (adenosine(37)-N6)-dimethylallyltransferase MiaA [Treponema sp.]|nr:tRNA (adenosine(37)-N6)-dimethylallyltransferase MiaA [Treponema sp.]